MTAYDGTQRTGVAGFFSGSTIICAGDMENALEKF